MVQEKTKGLIFFLKIDLLDIYFQNLRRYKCWRIDRAPWFYNEYLADEEIARAISCILLRFRSISILVVNKCCDKSRRIIENALRRDIPVDDLIIRTSDFDSDHRYN